MTDSAHYAELLAKQLAMNAESWRALQQRGVDESTQVRLDFVYHAPNKSAANQLRETLAAETDYDVVVKKEGGLLAKRWIVEGATQTTSISKSVLDGWVDWMVTAGAQHSCDFDGWGTEV